MATIKQVSKKWAVRAMKEFGKDYNPNEGSILEFGGQQWWNKYNEEVRNSSDFRKILDKCEEHPKEVASDMLEDYAKKILYK